MKEIKEVEDVQEVKVNQDPVEQPKPLTAEDRVSIKVGILNDVINHLASNPEYQRVTQLINSVREGIKTI